MTEIKSRKNPVLTHLKKLGSDSDYRRACGEFLCDGDKLLREALVQHADITAVLTSAGASMDLPESIPVYAVKRDIIDTVSSLKNPQELLFSCRIPVSGGTWPSDGCHIILEDVQDPGNVGTIIRSAAAFGIACVILVGACADPYNPKTVRASMGAIFRQPIRTMSIGDISKLKSHGIRIYGAALTESSANVRTADFRNAAVCIGSEGQGLSQELLKLCDETIKIPMAPGSESLNAAIAAAVIMWEAAKT